MLELISNVDLVEEFKKLLEQNQFLQGGFLLSIGAGIWYYVKTLPSLIYKRLKKLFLYEVNVYDTTALYDELVEYLIKDNKNLKKIKFRHDLYDDFIEIFKGYDVKDNDEHNLNKNNKLSKKVGCVCDDIFNFRESVTDEKPIKLYGNSSSFYDRGGNKLYKNNKFIKNLISKVYNRINGVYSKTSLENITDQKYIVPTYDIDNDYFYFWYKGNLIWGKKYTKELENASDKKNDEKNYIILKSFNSNVITFLSDIYENILLNDIESCKLDKKITAFSNTDIEFEFLKDIDSKVKTIVTEQMNNDIIIPIKKFIANEEKYIRRGTSYKMNLLFSGKGGLGKSKMVFEIGKQIGYDVYYINLGSLTNEKDLLNLISKIPKKSILVFEEIDKFFDKYNDSFKIFDISVLYNILSGIYEKHGLITIVTTNYPEKLEENFLRDKRFDLKIEFKEPKLNDVHNFLKNYFFLDDSYEFEDITYNNSLTFSNIETICEKYEDEQYLDAYKEIIDRDNKNLNNVD